MKQQQENYSYELYWRVGTDIRNGEGKRLATSQAWTGLGKYSSGNRVNSQIKDKEVRLIDLERLLPTRNFSNSLLRKNFWNRWRSCFHLKLNKHSLTY
jgi:hypothetical protein